MSDDEGPRCNVCPQLRSASKPRQYERPPVCEQCRERLADLLAEVSQLYNALPGSLERGVGVGQRVGGGEVEAPLPFQEDVWDLLLPASHTTIHDPFGDQIGYQSAATVLDSWARDWRDVRAMGEVGPGGTVAASTAWLRDRVDWACDNHPAIDEFAAELRALAAAIRRFVPRENARPQPCKGVPCRRCDMLTLARLSDGSGEIECQNPDCRTVLTSDEYRQWVGLVAAYSPSSGR